jgi:hypothetical protein
MTDRNRNETNRAHQSSTGGQGSPDRADDRGIDRDRRSFSGDREHDELGSEMEDDRAVEDRDDMGMDDGLGDFDREDR